MPNKLGGVVALFSAILVVAFLPLMSRAKNMVGCQWCVVKQVIFWALVAVMGLLR